MYELGSQIRRAAASIPANIAEGNGREHLGEYLHHLSIANGSLMELETHLLLARELGYADRERTDELLNLSREVNRMLAGLRRALRKRRTRQE